MPFTTLALGLTLRIPTSGTRNWGATMYSETWSKISQHKHTGGGDGNTLITASYSDYSVTTVKLSKNIGVNTATTLTPAGTTQTVDFDNGNNQILSLASASGDVTLTLSNGTTGATYKIFVTNGSTARDLVWPAAVLWPQGVKPIMTDTSAKVRVLLDYDGTNYWGTWDVMFS